MRNSATLRRVPLRHGGPDPHIPGTRQVRPLKVSTASGNNCRIFCNDLRALSLAGFQRIRDGGDYPAGEQHPGLGGRFRMPQYPDKPVPSVPKTLCRHGFGRDNLDAFDQKTEELHPFGRGGTGHSGRAASSVSDGGWGSGVVIIELVLCLKKFIFFVMKMAYIVILWRRFFEDT